MKKAIINTLTWTTRMTAPVLVFALIVSVVLVVGFFLTGHENFVVINSVLFFDFLAIVWAMATGVSIAVLNILSYEVDEDGNIILDEEEEKV